MNRCFRLLDGLGGTVHGSFFRVPDWVDTSKPPGATSLDLQDRPRTPWAVILNIVPGFFYSPNLTWFLMACLVWWIVPYHLEDSLGGVLKQRLIVNHALVLGYVGFWHVALYGFGFAKRPFVHNRDYSYAKLFHNMLYTWLGLVQWTITEVAFVHCYQAHRLNYTHDMMASCTTVLQTVLWSLLVPSIRDTHFYFAHRMIHTSFLYKYIHSVHHRNTDTEPFSGLCMHPVEHMYYFTCYAPCLFFEHSPFIVFWIGMHATITPAASHSGYEDHFSADLDHYLHHRYAECNYGAGIPFDLWFGTHRDRLKPSDVIPKDTKATLSGFVPEHPLYQMFIVGLVAFLIVARNSIEPLYMAILFTFLPCVFAALMGSKARSNSSKTTVAYKLIHAVLGLLFGVLPATYLLYLVLRTETE